MGWLFILVFAALTFAGLWRSRLLNRTALEMAAVAILVGLAGYAWQGSPSLPGVSATNIAPTG
jgi:cytochrome c-type biogenesis protein CcmH